MKNTKRIGTYLGTVVTAVASMALPVSANEFYAGKEVELIIGYAPGGGYDAYGRLVARHLGRQLPGKPNIIPRNMPGAGSINAANFLYAQAPKDGTAIGIITQTVAEEELLGTRGVRYQAAEFTWVGRITSNVNVNITWHTSKVKTIEDALEHEATLASNVVAGRLPAVLNNVVGTKFKLIKGYRGSSAGMLAMERGEVDGAMAAIDTLKARKPEWLREKKVNILVQYAPERYPEMPDVPAMVELGKTEEDKQVLKLFTSASQIGRSIVAPPEVPAKPTGLLRQAFQSMVEDPKFLTDVEKTRLALDPLGGKKLQKIIKDVATAPPEIKERAKRASMF